MGEHLTSERYYWFDNQVRAKSFPNATILAERFEISPKTAQRSIEFMRDRFLASLEYQPSRRGYCYTDSSFTSPGRDAGVRAYSYDNAPVDVRFDNFSASQP